MKRPQSIFADPAPFAYMSRAEQQRLVRKVKLATGREFRMLRAEEYRAADCDECAGTGFSHHDCGEDTCCCLKPEPNVLCDACDGVGYLNRGDE